MKKKPRLIGDDHVKSVHQALLQFTQKQPIDYYPSTILETVNYITNLYKNIEFVTSKFDSKHPDQEKDLTLHLTNNKLVKINLFLIKKGGRIQPKNPGAKSFLKKYFLSDQLQTEFNILFEKNYLVFLKELVEVREGTHYFSDKKELKKLVSSYFPRFTEIINPCRDKFLYKLRESYFALIKDFYNEKAEGFFHAFNAFFMTEDVNIITSYGENENNVSVENFNPGTPNFSDIQIYKSGKNTVGIRFGKIALTLRFKFESGPISSIKLAASYDTFPDLHEKENINSSTIQKMNDLLHAHEYNQTVNSSNAIGKCHEAISYYYFIKEYPGISQVETHECVLLLQKYYSLVKSEVLKKLFKSTSTIYTAIKEKLNEKYEDYTMESIELVPDSYISDRLNTGDLQLILKVNDAYIVENISLKALAKKSSKITTKNPGIGTILGPTFFNVGSMIPTVNEVKSRYENGELSHKGSLEVLSEELGMQLNLATQEQLKQGIENLLGKAMMAVTFYEDCVSYCKEHSKIDSIVSVYSKTPSAIQNTLAWNDDLDTISLRVKFSRGQEHGWSTIKLTSEYQLG
ncbi:hypothetical protein RCG23_25195 [Neobacillus sp. PS3-34]|uniref:hypothetical protein n=1 Tax=Neobacillus sp. PS3-34 TaxID=3070678 RepID=UPI0027E05A6B|nr:hypothetical protein [Neobacillus sp. PS3-34]WML48483.1 hypothetical protein RCG23_25195 [Neobacillus sp. PS3-34]